MGSARDLAPVCVLNIYNKVAAWLPFEGHGSHGGVPEMRLVKVNGVSVLLESCVWKQSGPQSHGEHNDCSSCSASAVHFNLGCLP